MTPDWAKSGIWHPIAVFGHRTKPTSSEPKEQKKERIAWVRVDCFLKIRKISAIPSQKFGDSE
jgi:hypothetical protein